MVCVVADGGVVLLLWLVVSFQMVCVIFNFFDSVRFALVVFCFVVFP